MIFPLGGNSWKLWVLVHHLRLYKMYSVVAASAASLQSCPTLCHPTDGSPLGSPIPGILQARTLEWVAISFSNACKWKVKVKSLSCVWLLATPWDFPGKSTGVGCHCLSVATVMHLFLIQIKIWSVFSESSNKWNNWTEAYILFVCFCKLVI